MILMMMMMTTTMMIIMMMMMMIIIIIIIIISKRTAHSQSKPPSPECSRTYRGKTKKGLDKRGNKRSGMVLYVLQTTFYKKLQENV